MSSDSLFDISFPESSYPPLRVNSVSFHQERFKHEYATVRFRDQATEYEQIRPGLPVNFQLNNGQASQKFYGYVHHIEPKISPGVQETVVHIIGATQVLKSASQKVWKDVTAGDVVRDIANTFNLNFLVDDHPRVFEQVSQAGHTAFEMLNQMAHRVGYTLRLTGTEIHFHHPTKYLEERANEALRFTMRGAQNPAGSDIYSFHPLIGETLNQEGEYKSAAAVSGIDHQSKQLHQVAKQTRPVPTRQKQEVEFFDRFLDVTAPNYQVAQYEAEAHDNRTLFPYRARVEVLGHPSLAPNQPIYLDGIGKEYSGHWIILKAEHKIVSEAYSVQRYTTVLEVGLDSLGSNNKTSNGIPYGQPKLAPARTITPNVRQTNTRPKSTLVKGVRHPVSKPKGFTTLKNKPNVVVAKKPQAASQWNGVTGNMKKTTPTPRTPTIVVNKTRAKIGL